MFGREVDLGCGIKVWINCLPSTSKEELRKRAVTRVKMYLDGEIDKL